ncbi:hypothetical protein VE04_07614 [Pseudogymnoascus sp. 24MN13]|nr:hypothetical protein VE04_07614 [Pseudogymnoascus sp. 24MN13]
MARPDPDEDSELNILNTSDVDKAVKSVVRWLRNENTTRYFEKHPVREVTHSTALATPTSTSCNSHTSIDQARTPLSSPSIAHESDPSDQTSTLFLPLHNAQAESGDFNDSTDLQKIPRDAPDQTSPAAQQDLENGSQPPYYSSIEHGDTLDSEHATNDSQRSASLEVSTPAEHNDASDIDAHPNGLPFTQTSTSLVQYRSNTPRDQPRKRKHNFEGCDKFKQARIGVTDATDVELGDKTIDCSKQITSQPVPIRDEQFGQHPELLEGARDTQPSIAVTPTTPASTPSNTDIPGQPAPVPVPSKFIKQEVDSNSGRDADQHASPFIKPHDQSSRAVDNQDESLFVDPHDHGPPATQEGGGHGVPPYQAYVEDAEDSSGDSQPSVNLDDWIPSSDGDDRQDGWSSGDSQHAANLDDLLPSSDSDDRQDGKPLRQGATSSISQQSNKSSKCKQNFRDRKDPKRLQIKALDGTEVYLGSRSPQLSETYELQSAPDRKDETHGQRPDTSDAGQDSVSRHSSEPPSATELPDGESDRFTELPADLRAKLNMIGDESTLAAIMDYVNYTANPPPSADYCADTLEDYQGIDTTSDQRFRALRNRIVRDEAEEEIVKYLRVSFRISKLFALAELSIRYTAAKDSRSAVPKKRRKKGLPQELPQELPRLSPRGLFTDLLFPEIGNIEGEGERNNAREAAKGKFSYWITLGDPLAELAKRFGSLILLILPENLKISDLHNLNRHHIQDFVDYIDLVRPGLKGKVINLSGVLLQRVDSSRPTQRQLLDILTYNLLSESRIKQPEELLQFVNHPSKSDLAQAVTSPSFDQLQANNQLSHPQRIVTSVEGISVDIENSQWQPPGAGPSASLGNSDEQSTRDMTDYFSQDGDWREQSHFSDHEREFLDSQNSSLQQSGPGEENLFDINSYVNFSPPNTPSIASPSSSQYPGQDSLAHLVDMPRASTPLQNLNKSTNHSPLASELHIKQPAVNIWQDTGMPDLGKIWNAHGQENRTVNPRDLLQTPKIKEHCSHHTRDFEKSGISVDERDHFYTELQEIRKLRNTVVHREVVDAATIERYKGSALGVLQIVRRLGGKDFEEAYGKSLDHLLHSFCEVESAPEAVVSHLYPLNIRCGQGIKTAMEEQISARRRRAINIDKMMEDFQVAQGKRAANQQRALQQKEDADKAKAERAQKARDREKEAEQTRIEAKRERACKAEALRMAAEEKKRIRQHKQAQIRAAADEP